jgi:hypothetical protein
MESAAFFLALAVLVGLQLTVAVMADRDPTLPLRRAED